LVNNVAVEVRDEADRHLGEPIEDAQSTATRGLLSGRKPSPPRPCFPNAAPQAARRRPAAARQHGA
jgi:hypothetical protein